MNLTKTVRKTPVDLDLSKAGAAQDGDGGARPAPKYDDEDKWWENVNISAPLTHSDFTATLARYPIVVVVRFRGGDLG